MTTLIPSVGWTYAKAAQKNHKKPFYISEYAHIMNNGMGNLADYWDAIERSDNIFGGSSRSSTFAIPWPCSTAC